MEQVRFVVEQAGCSSCATLVRKALARIGTVHEIEIDEASDSAVVRLAAVAVLEDTVNEILTVASGDTGHRYRVQPGSWSRRR